MPMFQHRHYAALADLLADARDIADNRAMNARYGLNTATLDYLEAKLGDAFKRDNENFNRDRFERAARRAPDMHGKDKR